ncbi:MAG: tRNA (N6-threonylcarbamoyladenosine(37)-N6)-methyltransferase TrmO [Pseudomonadota bacterium]|nr:tRNA (N6-threonylcarbamoyladenosine(37)-N6)-methyltransferase TrmO [Pseudomonadota bacterium]
MEFRLRPIGIIRSCFTDNFGIPRQARLVTASEARLELFSEFAREEAFTGLDGFSHAWIVFVFHDCMDEGWKPMVRPPRLGGRRKVGVFASRSPFRPNPIGISAVELAGLQRDPNGLALRLRGVDLLDGTPVLDVKPYVPYADSIPHARAGFAAEPPGTDWTVRFTRNASEQIAAADPEGKRQLELLIIQVLQQDPRPGYMDRYPERTEFGMRLYELDVRWRLEGETATVVAIEPMEREHGDRD